MRSTRQAKRIAVAVAAALAAMSCASAPPAPASLAVEVWSGAPASAAALGDTPVHPERVAIVLDLSSSMEAALRPDGPTRAEAARAVATRLLGALPADTGVMVETLGAASGSACTPAVRLEAEPAGNGANAGPASLVGPLRVLRPHSESSLDETLASVGDAIAQSGSVAGWRVVVVSDLGSECGGDPCGAIDRLVGRGVPVDIVDLAGSDTHRCVAPPPGPPPIATALAPPPPPPFRVEATADAPAPHALLTQGRAGQPAVAVPPGPAEIVVGFPSPLSVGPVSFRPGERARLEILHFPAAHPPVGTWHIETGASAADRN